MFGVIKRFGRHLAADGPMWDLAVTATWDAAVKFRAFALLAAISGLAILLYLGTGSAAIVLCMAVLLKCVTVYLRQSALTRFQVAKSIGNGLLTRGEIAQVARESSDRQFTTSMQADGFASVLLIGCIIFVFSQV